MKKSDGICEMCGHWVIMRQKAHIFAEGPKKDPNLLMLCPSCHVNFDVNLKSKLFKALSEVKNVKLPRFWASSIYEQARLESEKTLKKQEG
jgi:hypothetical protein